MRYVVAAVATLLIAISGLGVLAPERLVAIVSAWPPDTRLCVAVGTRLVLGVIFLLGASACRFPATMKSDPNVATMKNQFDTATCVAAAPPMARSTNPAATATTSNRTMCLSQIV